MKPSKCPANEKKTRQEKRKKRRRESENKKSRLLSAHSRTSQAKILHLVRKAVNGFVVKF